MRLKRSVTSVLLTYIALAAGCADGPAPGPAGTYRVMEVGLSDIELETAYPANIAGRQDIDIYPKISGFIERVCVREGETVRKGQTLFIIEQVQHQAALQTAEANVAAAKAAVATAQLVYDSKKELFDNDVVSQFDLSTAANQLLTAQAQLAQAEAQEVDARNNLSYTLVASPANGIVGTIPYREGTLVSASMPRPLTTVSDNSQMYVYFSMPESQLLRLIRQWGSTAAALQDMPEVALTLNDGSLYPAPGRIETISGVIDSSTGAVSMRAEFPNAEGLLRSGGSGNVVIPSAFREVVVIPQSATFEIQDKIYAFRVVDGIARQTLINVANVDDGTNYIVESGIAVGDVIVTEGVGMLRDGTEIGAGSGTGQSSGPADGETHAVADGITPESRTESAADTADLNHTGGVLSDCGTAGESGNYTNSEYHTTAHAVARCSPATDKTAMLPENRIVTDLLRVGPPEGPTGSGTGYPLTETFVAVKIPGTTYPAAPCGQIIAKG